LARRVRRPEPPSVGRADGPMRRAAAPTVSLKGRALRWLSQREHSRAELARKLLRVAQAASSEPGASAEEDDDEDKQHAVQARVEAVLDQLTAAGLLDDARAAESVVSAKAARCGERGLRQWLHTRGLSGEVAEQALAGARGGEFDRARELWRRRFGVRPTDAREMARQSRFLASRGFGADTIRRLLRSGDFDDEGVEPEAMPGASTLGPGAD